MRSQKDLAEQYVTSQTERLRLDNRVMKKLQATALEEVGGWCLAIGGWHCVLLCAAHSRPCCRQAVLLR